MDLLWIQSEDRMMNIDNLESIRALFLLMEMLQVGNTEMYCKYQSTLTQISHKLKCFLFGGLVMKFKLPKAPDS